MYSVRTIFLWLISIVFLCSTPSVVLAQTGQQNNSSGDSAGTLGIARIVETKTKNVKDGSIMSTSQTGAILSNVPYDSQVVGIVATDAGILFATDSETGVPVVSSGTTYVLVSARDGPIKKGDLITTSTIPGVGVKALKSGYVLGTALEEYSSSDPKHFEKIAVDLDMHYFNTKPAFPGSLSDIFKLALLPTKDGPAPIFKYIVAAGVVVASFVLGFVSFGRTAAKGVEALGRNPAAGRIIHLGIIFNVAIVIAIIAAGLTVAFLILRL